MVVKIYGLTIYLNVLGSDGCSSCGDSSVALLQVRTEDINRGKWFRPVIQNIDKVSTAIYAKDTKDEVLEYLKSILPK